MNKKALIMSIVIPCITAILGNILISETALDWYNNLIHPWYKLPMTGSILVAFCMYIGYGIIIYRSFAKSLLSATVLAILVIVANEIWNLVFFGSRDLTLTFWTTVVFAILVLAQVLQIRNKDRLSYNISTLYLAWVVLYDLPWLYQLSVMNCLPLS